MDFNPSRSFAENLDTRDALATYRSRFVITDPDIVYLDGNSLGRLTHASLDRLRQVAELEWGRDLIRGWNENWWEAPVRIGDKIGRLVGAAPGQIVSCDTVSVNLFKLAAAALALRPGAYTYCHRHAKLPIRPVHPARSGALARKSPFHPALRLSGWRYYP